MANMIQIRTATQIQSGFILVATIWMLAGITLAAGYFATWASQQVEEVRQVQINTQGELDVISTRSTIMYLLASRYYSHQGLTIPASDGLSGQVMSEEELLAQLMDPNFNLGSSQQETTGEDGTEIRVDDRAYQGIGMARFALQDSRGLISIRGIDWAQLQRLLAILGVDSEYRQPLLDKFHDYIDIDIFNRLNGAEQYQYREAKLAPPTNRLLRTPMEIRRIMGWMKTENVDRDSGDDADFLIDQAEIFNFPASLWKQVVTIAPPVGVPNFNTASLPVLQSFVGIDKQGAEQLIAARETRPFKSENRVFQTLGRFLPIEPEDLFFMPSYHLRLTLWYTGGQQMQQIHLTMTPGADLKQPWEIHYQLDLPLLAQYQTPTIHEINTPVFTTALPTEN